MTAYAYLEFTTHAIVGPLGAHKVGDIIELPTRTHAYLHHEIPGDTFIVTSIEKDGAGWAQRKSLYDAAQEAAVEAAA